MIEKRVVDEFTRKDFVKYSVEDSFEFVKAVKSINRSDELIFFVRRFITI